MTCVNKPFEHQQYLTDFVNEQPILRPQDLLCKVDQFASRCCELGTRGCIVEHKELNKAQQEGDIK